MVKTLSVLAMALMVAQASVSGELPDELKHIEPLFSDEEKLVEAVREYDRAQIALAKWDWQLAQEHEDAGETAMAEEKRQRADKRIRSIARAYEETVNRYPKNARAQTYYGELLYDYLGQQVVGFQKWKLAVAMDPEMSAAHNDLGIHYCHNGDVPRGVNHLDRALKIEPENPDYLFNLCQIYMNHFPEIEKIRKWDRKRVYKEAMKASKKAADLSPNDFDLLQDYAVNFYAAENFQVEADWRDAAHAWAKAREKARNRDEEFYSWLNEGRVWARQGDAARARSCLEKALEIHPDSRVASDMMAKLSASAKDSKGGKGDSGRGKAYGRRGGRGE